MATSTTTRKVLQTWNWENEVMVKYQEEDGSSKIEEATPRWYFAVKLEDEEALFNCLGEHGFEFEIDRDPKFPKYSKCYVNEIPNKQKRVDIVLSAEQAGIKTYEGDLMSDKRWYIDQEVEIGTVYKKLYFDIETDDTIRKIEIGRDRVLSWAAIDDKGRKYFERIEAHTDEAEKKLLEKFNNLLKKYDIILGWNSKGFDVPYLKTRMKYHRVKMYPWKQVASFDLLKRFRHIFRFDNHIKKYSLEYISQHFLGKGKVPHSESIFELWRDNPELLKEYNLEDCVLVKELDEKLGVSNMMVLQSQWCGVPPAQFGLYSIIDAFIMKTAHSIGEFCRTSVNALVERKKENERGNENPGQVRKKVAKYTGAYVIDPEVGMYKKVYTFDFKSLYPSMMRTSNIGFDSISRWDDGTNIINPGTLDIVRKSGSVIPTYFSQEMSVINLAITELLKKRKEYKKLKLQMIEDGTNKGPGWERVVSDEIIVKELANSTYGIMGLEYGRYYSIDIAESITLFGQWVINFAKKFFESRGYQVIYGDTDSVFVAVGHDLDQRAELDIFHENLNVELKDKFRISDCHIELEPDKVFEKLILIAKKTYVGHVTDIEGKKTDDIYARGLDFIKKNTFSYAAKKQRELIDLILKQEADTTQVRDFARASRDDFYSREFEPSELSIVQRVGKKVDDYKSPPLHVQLAKEIEDETGESLLYTDIEYIVTSGSGKKQQGVVIEKFDGNFDRDYYWENKTRNILERVTLVAYPGVEDFYTSGDALFDVDSKAVSPKKERKPRVKKDQVEEPDQMSIYDFL